MGNIQCDIEAGGNGMIYVQILVRTALLMLSVFGYILFLSKYVRPELTPGLTFSGMGSLLFAAGLLNVLQETAWCIFLLGMLLLGYSLLIKKEIKAILSPGIIFFTVVAAFFFLLLHGSIFENIDNFTHWAVASKVLYKTDFFPDLDRVIYRYPSYPVGSACFIYYVSEIVGIQSEWLRMWAQAFLMAGMISGLFVFAKQKCDSLLVAVASVILLCSGVNFVDLLVDTLLPVTAISAFCFCICYREKLSEKIKYILPYTVFLVSIKNSGILFAAAVLLYAVLLIEKNACDRKRWLWVVCLTLAVFYFWNKHVEAVFGVAVSTHSMSLENYRSVISSTSIGEKQQIIRLFLSCTISGIKTSGLLMLAGVILWIWSGNGEKAKGIRRILVITAVFYLVYQVGMLGMYLLSMPKEEALELAGYSRYQQTILIFSAGVLLAALLLSGEGRSAGRRIAIAVVVLGVFCVALQPNFHFYMKQDRQSSLELQDRVRAEKLVSEYGIPEQGKYLIVVSDDRENKAIDGPFREVRRGYVWHLLEYLLDPEEITVQYASQVTPDDTEQFGYVILFDETEAGRQFLIDVFDESEENVVCVYER
ncbi:MAG: hypothetical protein IJE27_07650 [Anaerotignum sp.]|nr:hypothetical protein [Anaerotignum sp.]